MCCAGDVVVQAEQQGGLSARIKILETRLEEQATELQRVNNQSHVFVITHAYFFRATFLFSADEPSSVLCTYGVLLVGTRA